MAPPGATMRSKNVHRIHPINFGVSSSGSSEAGRPDGRLAHCVRGCSACAGVDKFFHFLVNWDQHLSPLVTRMLPVSAHTFMLGVGVIEIVAALLVAFKPAIGAWIVVA